MVKIRPEHWAAWEKHADKPIPIYMLDESRKHYRNEEPPFTIKYTMVSIPGDVSEHGTRPLSVNLVSLRQTFGKLVKITEVQSHVILKRYDATTAFWTLDIGNLLVIVHTRGGHYYPWLGPGGGLSTLRVDLPRSRNGRSLIPSQYMEEPGGSASYRSDSQELYEAVSTEGVEPGDDAATAIRLSSTSTEIDGHATPRLRKRVGRNRDNDFWDVPSDSDYGSGANAPPNQTNSKKTRYSSFTGPTTPTRSASLVEQSQDMALMTPSSNPTLVTAYEWTSDQLNNTTFFIEISSNDFGACPVYLRSCQTIDEFFKNGLDAWGLEDKTKEIVAVTIKFDWLPKKRPTIVTPKVPDSYQHVLRTIQTADCWLPGGSNECSIQVTFNMAA